jgi:hypothetical protein
MTKLFKIETPSTGIATYYRDEDDARADSVAVNESDIESGEYVDVDSVEENGSTFLSDAAREALGC